MWAPKVWSESHASRIVTAIKIYDTLERSALKIRRSVFVSCIRAKGCNFCGLLTFCSETFLWKLSPLNALRNCGDRWGKLSCVRKHKSQPAASLRWLARKTSEAGNSNVSGNWFGCSVRGCLHGRLSPRSEFTPVPSHGSIFVYMIPPQNVMPARVTPGCEFTPVLVPEREFHSGTKSRNGIM